jgi:nucleoside-diphosphate-sugar epimerase
MPWVATADVARAVATAIERVITGSFVLPGAARTGHEVADAIGAAMGRTVRWEHVDPDAYAEVLRPHLGDHAADGTAAAYRMLQEGPPAPAPDPEPARAALGWAPRSVEQWASEVPWPVASTA